MNMALKSYTRCRLGKAKTVVLILLVTGALHLMLSIKRTGDAKVHRISSKRPVEENKSTADPRTKSDIVKVTRSTAPEKTVAILERDCNSPQKIHDGVPWPNCGIKMNWMKGNWKKDKCYASYGVSDDPCSMMNYLSEVEHHCPSDPSVKPRLEPLFLDGEMSEPRDNFQHLYAELDTVSDYSWIKNRTKSMESFWIKSSSHLFTRNSSERMRKRIHLHFGVMTMELQKNAVQGGVTAELVQWSDLIAALFITGHDIVITSRRAEVDFVYREYKSAWTNSGCPPSTLQKQTKIPFDLIYTDATGLQELRRALGDRALGHIECRVRVLDSFGTEASFNHPSYMNEKKVGSTQYNGMDINLQQINTMFPHTPDNTFLGYVAEISHESATAAPTQTEKRDIALVYGNMEEFWSGKEKYINIIKEYVTEIHATVHKPKNLPSYIINHGVVGTEKLVELMRRTKIFVGLGLPLEGPEPLEAIESGAVFLNPKFREPLSLDNRNQQRPRSTNRRMTSQHPYISKNIGKPYVYTVDIDDENALREALKEITSVAQSKKFLPHEFSILGFLERVSTVVEKQNFCTKISYSSPYMEEMKNLIWPPFSTLEVRVSGIANETCNNVCEGAKLICEPSFFPVLNREEGFKLAGFSCNEVKTPDRMESDYPAYDNGVCYLQTNPRLFSCAENYLHFQRLCPCKERVNS